MSFFEERKLPELNSGRLGKGNSDEFLSKIISYIKGLESDLSASRQNIVYQKKSNDKYKEEVNKLENMLQSKDSKISELNQKKDELTKKIKSVSKEKNRAWTRAEHSDKNMQEFLDHYIKLVEDDGEEYSIPHYFKRYCFGIEIKKKNICLIKYKKVEEPDDLEDSFNVEINGRDIDEFKQNSIYLKVNDEIKIYKSDICRSFRFQIQSVFKPEKIDIEQLPDIEENPYNKKKTGVEGFVLTED